jgi:hypothetical protein
MDSLKLLEAILARFTPRDRAASILGDLTELSATRGRLWFYAACARTLIALAWRTPVAFLIAVAGVWLSFRGIILMQHAMHLRLSGEGLFRGYNTLQRIAPWRPPMRMRILQGECYFLFFALPFALVRFGVRSRLTQLAFALLLLALPIYSLRAMPMDLAVVFTVVAIVAAIFLPLWRRPMIALAAAGIAPEIFWYLLHLILRHKHLTALQGFSSYFLGQALAAFICIRLYPPSPVEMTAPFGTNNGERTT